MFCLRALVWKAIVPFLLLSCAPQPKEGVSESKEGIDANNKLDALGLEADPLVEDILAVKRVQLDRLPWTDTYWPLADKGVSRRWDVVSPNNEKDPAIWPSNFFRSHAEFALGSLQINPMISPAEKYDMLFRWRHRRDLNWDELRRTIEPMYAVEERISSAVDLAERRSLVSELSRQFNAQDQSFYRQYFPMTSDGWSNWLKYTGNAQFEYLGEEGTGEDWRWMGYCHGWAPAAIMAETPRHAVLVRFGWQEVLLTEGDIRGLLTKSWSDHWPAEDMYFLGRRCNKNVADVDADIPLGSNGRGLYGTLRMTPEAGERGFFVKAEYFAGFTRPNERIYPLSFDEPGSLEGFLLEQFLGLNRGYRYVYAAQVPALQAYVERGDASAVSFPTSAEIFGCWDLNPATFHMALLQKLGKEKQSLVIDRTRSGQVWNQPIYEAKFSFSDLKLASTTTDVLAQHRAPGTKYLLEVKADVKWTSEPTKPRMVYEEGFDRRYLITTSYEYTLEFDRAQRLIGGEWGLLEEIKPKQKAPDFIFGFKEGSLPRDDIARGFDYSGLIARIHACSLSPNIDGSMRVQDQNIPYSRCSIDRVED